MTVDPSLIALARAAAADYALEPALVCAVIEQESGWDTHAMRYESAFRTRYVAPLGLPASEEIARSISWGLMQVMGQVAREHSCDDKYLTALCEPGTGIKFGCVVLAGKLELARRIMGFSAGSAALHAGSGKSQTFQCTADCRAATLGCVTLAPEPMRTAKPNDVLARALELWNGGSNPNYPAEVLARVAKYRS